MNNILSAIDNTLNNKTFSVVVSLILVLYAGLAAPALPNQVIQFFDTMLGKVLFLFLIGFVASRNVQVALMVAVAYVVTLHIATQRSTENFINKNVENFNNIHGKEDEVMELNEEDLENLENFDNCHSGEEPAERENFSYGSGGGVQLDELEKENFYGGASNCPEGDCNEYFGKHSDQSNCGGKGQPACDGDHDAKAKSDEEAQKNEKEEFSVNPAFNLDGNSKLLYAPVKF